MSPLKKVFLTYNPVHSSWSYSSKQAGKMKAESLYWGAEQEHLKIQPEKEPKDLLIPLHALVTSTEKKFLGPVIGILSAENQRGGLFGLIANYKALMKAGYEHGAIVFVFTPSDVNWIQRKVKGRIFDFSRKKWISAWFPLPNIVYNRILNRRYEKKEKYQACLLKLSKHPHISLFNQSFFDKDELINTLRKSSVLSPYVPQTTRLQQANDMIQFLKSYKQIYLKPTTGRAGSGIMKVEWETTSKRLILSYYKQNTLTTLVTKSIQTVWKKIRQHMLRTSYIVQQAIQTATIDDCSFDFRVLVQKNGKGKWQISGTGIRVAGSPASITTHVPRGGRIQSAPVTLQQAFPHETESKLINRVHRLCLAIAHYLDNQNGQLGEMTLDIGVDQQGHPFFFEANSKPMKFDEPDIRQAQLESIIRYAQFLTFRSKQHSLLKT